MTHYLVVAHQTADSEELVEAVRDLAEQGDSTFALLIPATPVSQLATWTEGEAHADVGTCLDRRCREGYNVELHTEAASPGTGAFGDGRRQPSSALRNHYSGQPFVGGEVHEAVEVGRGRRRNRHHTGSSEIVRGAASTRARPAMSSHHRDTGTS